MNGTIELSSGNWIGPTTRRSAFLITPEGLRSSTIVNSGPLSRYVLRGVRLTGELFDVLLTFDGEVLRTMTLVRESMPLDRGIRSAQSLFGEKLANDHWLRMAGKLESKTTAAWGSVESLVDDAMGAAAIVVSFVPGADGLSWGRDVAAASLAR